VIISFKDSGTREIFEGRDTKTARRTCPPTLWKVAWRKLDQLDSAASPYDMAAPPGNRLEELKGSRRGEFSVRVNGQFRLCFRWGELGAEQVEITDYH
jgi:proteic killer suppression protein